jgi:hypothetical protein
MTAAFMRENSKGRAKKMKGIAAQKRGSASKLLGDGAYAFFVPIIADDEKCVNHTRQPDAKSEKDADEKAALSPGQEDGERRTKEAQEEVHGD